MSGSIASIPLAIKPMDPAAAGMEYADLAQRQAQTGLIGAQTQTAQQQALAAALANRFAALRYGMIGGWLGGGQPGAGAPMIGNASAASIGGEPSPNGPGGGAGGPQMPPPVTPYGAVASPSGVAVPGFVLATSMKPDGNIDWNNVYQGRARAIGQTLGAATDPQTWNAAVQRLYGSGYLSTDEYLQLHGRPELRQAALNAVADPNEYAANQVKLATAGMQMGGAGQVEPSLPAIAAGAARAGAVKAAELPATIAAERAKPIKTAPTEAVTLLPTGQGAVAQPLANIANGQPMAGDEWANRSMLSEGGPTGKTSATSSAAGTQNFIDSTWLEQMRAHHPDITQGKSDAEVLAMRSNAGLSNQLALEYAGDNAPQLVASGLPANAASLNLAHQLGPSGAIAALKAPEGTPMSQIVPASVITANPGLANMTNSQLWGQVVSRFGTGPVQGVAGGAPAPTAQPAAGTPVPTPGGGAVIPPRLSPFDVSQQQHLAEQIKTYQDGLTAKSQAAAAANARFDQMRLDSNTWTMGKFADFKMDALSALDSFKQNINGLVGSQVFTPDKSVGDWQSFVKNSIEAARIATRETSARAAVQEMQMIRQSLPTPEMSPQGFRQIVDMLQGVNDWYMAKTRAAGSMGATNPATFDAQWNQNITPGAFILHRMSTDDMKALHDRMVQSAPGRSMWNDWVQQLQFLDKGGFFHPSMAGLPTGRQLGTGTGG